MNANTATVIPEPKSCQEFNQTLDALGILPMSDNDILQLKKTETRQRLIQALKQAKTNPNAKMYLLRVTQQYRSNQPSSPATANPPGQRQPMPVHIDNQPEPQSQSLPYQEHAPDSLPDNKESYLSCHAYGSKAAVCVNANEYNGLSTVSLQGALAKSPRVYDWDNKIIISVTEMELPAIACVLLGLLSSCAFANHGQQKNKGFKIENQAGKIFFQLFEKGKPAVGVPVSPADAYKMASITLKQLQHNTPWLTITDTINVLRLTEARLLNTGN